MTEEEIVATMRMSIPELLNYCKNTATAKIVLSLAIQRGIEKGCEQSHSYYGMLLRGYDEVSIGN